ncbi:MAG: Gfo/Idh/MocA family oxidoreductase, partial [Candidatus Hydrogenedentes bacterium]|nr:Gfo/Idh/MocA family oxidoreductase [Candidatus Hydrogenedentota bacterium]
MQRIIQIGLGAMGQGWADCVARSEKWEAAAYVDPQRKGMAAAADRHGMPKKRCFPDINAALRTVEADAILDVTPPKTRTAICTAAMNSGLDVLCEKPLADTLGNAAALTALAQTTGRTLMVAQNYRYQPVVQTAKKFIARGRLGKIGYAGVSFHKGPHFGGFREQMAYPLLLDMAIHHFDMMRCILGKDIEVVQGTSINTPWNWNKGEATVSACLELEGSIGINYFASWVSQGWETDWNGNWRIEGEKGV